MVKATKLHLASVGRWGRTFMKRLYRVFTVILILGLLSICSLGAEAATRPLSIFVSILPQRYFVQRIAGSTAQVSVMVRPGADPVTYEPSPRQMAELAGAQAYLRIGVPFEEAWLGKIKKSYPGLAIIDTRQGITLRHIEGHHHEQDQGHESGDMAMDPHIWLSPRLVKRQAETIYKTLVALNPSQKEAYTENYREFTQDLEKVDQEIGSIIGDGQGRKFLVFHPAWGYFADEYGLCQIPIEVAGKEPTAKELAQTIDLARRENIKVIFVQSQFDTKPAEAVARAVGGKVVQIDPLAEDYLANLVAIAKAIAAGAR